LGVRWIVLGVELSRVLSLVSMQGKVRKKQESVPWRDENRTCLSLGIRINSREFDKIYNLRI
jgi:hypothetical protein